jgi:hypothetical protein
MPLSILTYNLKNLALLRLHEEPMRLTPAGPAEGQRNEAFFIYFNGRAEMNPAKKIRKLLEQGKINDAFRLTTSSLHGEDFDQWSLAVKVEAVKMGYHLLETKG